MRVLANERIDILNIFLIFLSAVLAIFIPFELFLFSYALFGPLHYLTEISWLHDKKYFTKNRHDYIYLIIITACISFVFLNVIYKFIDLDMPRTLASVLAWLAVLLAILFVTVKNGMYRILGIIVILACLKLATTNVMTVYMTVFLPTLIHVYIFTGLFMLYGALKSKSRMGLISVTVFAICPFLLLTLFPTLNLFGVTDYAQRVYSGNGTAASFLGMSIETLHLLFGTTVIAPTHEEASRQWANHVFHSSNGMAVARVVAFAYTYHYLNWFSKTKIIQWHKVPKLRFIVVIIAWILSVGLYIADFTTGMIWLFFLSMMHVLLELPLNTVSVIGIYNALRQRVSGNKAEVEAKPVKG